MSKKSSQAIHFHFQASPFYLPNRTELKKFIKSLIIKEKHVLERIDYIFCTDPYLHELNVYHLGHDTYTDILTFGLSTNKAIKAEIYISIDRVRENAKTFQCPLLIELYRVIFHGALHLCGYKDKALKDKAIMRNKENKYLKLYSKQ